jgi:hypothetical protein
MVPAPAATPTVVERSCRKSCAASGLCQQVDGRCQALSNSDCEASTGCRREGACFVRFGRCTTREQADEMTALIRSKRLRSLRPSE